MNLHLRGHAAIVCGSARGIGKAIAHAFAAEGCRLALLDRDEQVHGVARDLGGVAEALDVTDGDAVAAAAARIKAGLERIDHVVFAAAVGSGKFGFPFWRLTPQDWPRVFAVNVMGAVHVAHAFAPYLVEAQSGTMLFLASVAGQIGSQTDPPYSASKAALINFAQCAARDLAPYGVRVNTICPGMVQTDLNRSVWQAWHDQQPEGEKRSYEDWAGEKVRKVIPLGRWQTPEDIASMAVFLASARAGEVTGQTINVDGGFVMHW
jgi:NAD(P)-dependent dehydrogenase (short-subunit alcohol dehydrogenase family)